MLLQAPRPSPFGQATESAEQSREDEANEDNDLTSFLSTNLSQPTDGDDGSELDTVPWPIIAPNMIKPGYAPVCDLQSAFDLSNQQTLAKKGSCVCTALRCCKAAFKHRQHNLLWWGECPTVVKKRCIVVQENPCCCEGRVLLLSRECLPVVQIVSYRGEDSTLMWSRARLTVRHQIQKHKTAHCGCKPRPRQQDSFEPLG